MDDPSSTKNQPWQKKFVKRYNNKILLQAILIPLVPFFFVLVEAILYPGMIYCTDTSCPSGYLPPVPDTATLVVVLVLYSYCTVLCSVILCAPGAWMKQRFAFRNKLVALSTIFLMACSVCQMVAPIFYRGFVVPYYSLQPYGFDIATTQDGSVSVNLTNAWSNQYLEDALHYQLDVFEVHHNVKSLQDLNPLFPPVYRGASYSHAIRIEEGTNVSTAIQAKLHNDAWYLFQLVPVYKAVGDVAASGTYIFDRGPITFNNVTYKDAFVDVRMFKICLWDSSSCSSQGSVH